MALVKVDDHVEQAQGLLIEQFQERPRLAVWLASFSARCQEAEDMLWDVLFKRLIDNAEGHQLDMIGAIVGEPRHDRPDAVYKIYVLARIRINWSQGNPDDVIAVLRIVEPAAFRYTEIYPASFEVQYLDVPTAATLEILADLASQAKEAGMAFAVVGSEAHPATEQLRCTYLDDLIHTSSTGMANNAETTGGTVASIYAQGL